VYRCVTGFVGRCDWRGFWARAEIIFFSTTKLRNNACERTLDQLVGSAFERCVDSTMHITIDLQEIDERCSDWSERACKQIVRRRERSTRLRLWRHETFDVVTTRATRVIQQYTFDGRQSCVAHRSTSIRGVASGGRRRRAVERANASSPKPIRAIKARYRDTHTYACSERRHRVMTHKTTVCPTIGERYQASIDLCGNRWRQESSVQNEQTKQQQKK
jgi:hypothetical protein